MARVKIFVANNYSREEVVIDVPEWGDLTVQDQEILVAEAAAPAVERMEPVVSHQEVG